MIMYPSHLSMRFLERSYIIKKLQQKTKYIYLHAINYDCMRDEFLEFLSKRIWACILMVITKLLFMKQFTFLLAM